MNPPISFQMIDLRDYHEIDDDDECEEYVIRIFGRTALKDANFPDKSVCCTIKDFTPFFFVKIPQGWNESTVKRFYSSLKEKQKNMIEYNVIKKSDFDGFHGYEKFTFIQLKFLTSRAMRNCATLLSNPYYFSGKRYSFELYESNMDPTLKFLHNRNLRGCSWAKVVKYTSSSYAITDLDIECSWKDIELDVENSTSYARLRILSYDIEVMSSDPDGAFPQASNENDNIIQIGMTYNYYQESSCYLKQLLNLNTCDAIEGVDVICCGSEKEMLERFVEIIDEQDPDIICGYNIFGFDNKYMHDRAIRLGVSKLFSQWSRLEGNFCKFVEKKLSSSALGDNLMYFYESDGRVQIDLLKIVQRDYNLENYKLDFVSSHFNQNVIKNLNEFTFETPNVSGLDIGSFFHIKVIDRVSGVEDLEDDKYKVVNIDGKVITYEGTKIKYSMKEYDLKWTMAKDDLPPKKIFEYFKIDSYHRSLVGKYCIKDCILVNFLMEKLDVLSNNIAMSNVCWVPLYYIFIRGQGIKSFSLVAQQCRKEGYLIPTIKKENFTNKKNSNYSDDYVIVEVDNCTFEKCKYYINEENSKVKMKEYIVSKDRVCCECDRIQYYTNYEGAKVFEPTPGVYWDPITVLDYASLYPRSIISRNMSWETQVKDEKYLDIPNFKYYDVSYRDSLGNEVKCKFAQEGNKLGIIPMILLNLLEERDATKKQMKKEKDPFKKKILDGHQLALKVTANSLYGQLGAITSPIYRKDIAACTTSVGQTMLGVAQTFVEDKFPAILEEANELSDLKSKLPQLDNIDEEWELVKDIKENFNIKPKVIYGDSVTGDTPLILRLNNKVYIRTIEDLSKTWISYEGFKHYDKGLTNKEQSTCPYEVWSNGKWTKIIRVIRHYTYKDIYRVKTSNGIVDVTEDHSLLDSKLQIMKPIECTPSTKLLHSYPNIYLGNEKCEYGKATLNIPDDLLNASAEVKTKYFEEYIKYNNQIASENKLFIAKWYYLLKMLLYEPYVREINHVYYLFFDGENDCRVKSVTKLEKVKQYVYDLETEEGNFNAGIGEIVVKNTDSVFVNLNLVHKDGREQTHREHRIKAMKLGVLAGDLIKSSLDYPHDLEYDKTFHPWLVVCKKKYAGPKYEEDPDKFHMTYMGIVLKRRDNAKIVKKVCGGILNILLKEQDYTKVQLYTKNILESIIQDKFDITYFITTKTLRSNYKGKKLTTDSSGKKDTPGTWIWYDVNCSVAHVQLCQKMRNRDLGSAPQVNDRISFVQVIVPEKGKKKMLQGERIEEVSYVLENKLSIDYNYYIANQIMIPACQFLELIIKNPKEKLFQPILDELEFKKNNRTRILEKMRCSSNQDDFCVINF